SPVDKAHPTRAHQLGDEVPAEDLASDQFRTHKSRPSHVPADLPVAERIRPACQGARVVARTVCHQHPARNRGLGLGDDLFDVAGGGGGGEGSGAEVVHDVQVVVQVRGRLQVEGAGEVLDVDHVGQGGFGEAQDSERAARRGVASLAERYDLQADLGQGGDLEQVVQLG